MYTQKMAPPQDKLLKLLIKNLKNFAVALMKEVLMQSIKKAFAEAFKLGFLFAKTDLKSAFSCFLEIALIDMMH